MSTFLALRTADKKDESLRAALRTGSSYRHEVEPDSFLRLPGTAFVYWVGSSVLSAFSSNPSLISRGWTSAIGLQTSDDFRFVRLWTEGRAGEAAIPLAKGGAVTSYYSDIPLVIVETAQLHELKAFAETTPGTNHWSRNLRSSELYFRSGLTWARRPHRRGWFATLPSGCVFSDSGPTLFTSIEDHWVAAAVLNSEPYGALLHLLMARGSVDTSQTLKYEAGYVNSVPAPRLHTEDSIVLGAAARAAWSLRRAVDTAVETSRAFVIPALLQVDGSSPRHRREAWVDRLRNLLTELRCIQSEIDELCFGCYGISAKDREAVTQGLGVGHVEATEDLVGPGPEALAAGLVSWAVGVSVGRFDVRLATGERGWPAEPDPFDALPVCSPGMLTGVDGLPLVESPVGYPVGVSPVLVDDPGHELDVAARVRSVFDVVFGADADDWWVDVGAALGARDGEVPGWLRKGFFDHHLKEYSKSRRKAPILWPIGTASGSYVVWLFAHRVTGDSLFQVLNDIVDPKLSVEQRRLVELSQEAGLNPSASQRKAIDTQESFVGELRELRDELEAVTPLWAPDLNDGIVIVLAPLWKLFGHHKPWSKELKKHWDKLAAGDYDWAQLAMHLWPERVIPKCVEDRSLAIAHDLEDVFWVQDADNTDKWHPRATPTMPLDELIAQRHNPATKAALQRATT